MKEFLGLAFVFILLTFSTLHSQTIANGAITTQQKDSIAIATNTKVADGLAIAPEVKKTNPRLIPLTPEQAEYLRAQGLDPDKYAIDPDLLAHQSGQQPQQSTVASAQKGLDNAMIYLDHFLGSGKTMVAGDVINLKRDALKFSCMGKEYDYSGNYSICLNTPRQHKNSHFGLGSVETAKILTLEDFFKGTPNGTIMLQDAKIWEKSSGFIVAEAMGKEWIHSGSYTIQK